MRYLFTLAATCAALSTAVYAQDNAQPMPNEVPTPAPGAPQPQSPMPEAPMPEAPTPQTPMPETPTPGTPIPETPPAPMPEAPMPAPSPGMDPNGMQMPQGGMMPQPAQPGQVMSANGAQMDTAGAPYPVCTKTLQDKCRNPGEGAKMSKGSTPKKRK
jgi:hypothetical protein